MILDTLKTTLCDYGNMNIKLVRAFDWLKSTDLKALEPGTVVTIDGGRVFAQIHAYQTKRPEECSFETHRSFIDVQYIVSGREYMFWAPLAALPKVKTPYNFERDLVFFEEPEKSVKLFLEEGDFAVFFPSDGHKPSCMIDAPAPIKKIVVKVAV